MVGPVAGAALGSARAAHRISREAVRRTRARRARTALGDVALTVRCAAGRRRRQEDVHAGVTAPRAVVGPVASAALRSTRAAHRISREAVRRTRTRAVAGLGYVASTRSRRAAYGRVRLVVGLAYARVARIGVVARPARRVAAGRPRGLRRSPALSHTADIHTGVVRAVVAVVADFGSAGIQLRCHNEVSAVALRPSPRLSKGCAIVVLFLVPDPAGRY